MRIVQWNTHHGGLGSDGKLSPERIGKFLSTLKADVICLNEVEQNDSYGNRDCVQIYCDALGAGWKGVFANLKGELYGKGQGNAILSALAMTTPTIKPLVNNRVAIQTMIGNIPIISTHLDSESENVRNIQNYQLNFWLHDLSRLIICADFNSLPDSVTLAPNRYWYKDAWTESVKLGTATSFNGTGNTKSHRIDMIFAKGLAVRSCDVPSSTTDGIVPSDHNPVVAVY
jgi:endonuclease/exonuclease/phosphatase family metal-dependent hydrolase